MGIATTLVISLVLLGVIAFTLLYQPKPPPPPPHPTLDDELDGAEWLWPR